MRLRFKTFITALIVLTITVAAISCKKDNIKKVEVDNSFAFSLFNDDSITTAELLDEVDSAWREIVRVAEDGSLSIVVTSDTTRNIITGAELLNNIGDIVVEEHRIVDVPNLRVPDSLIIVRNLIASIPPGTPVPPFEYQFSFDTTIDLNHVASVAFNVDNFKINEVVMKSGIMNFNLSFAVDPAVSFSVNMVSEEITKEGQPMEIEVMNHDQLVMDLADWTIKPVEDSVRFSAEANVTIATQLINQDTPLSEIQGIIDRLESVGGNKEFLMVGSVSNMSIKSVDGEVDVPVQRFRGDIDSLEFHIKQLSGDLWLKTPFLELSYINTFGFNVRALIDSLHYVNDNEEMIGVIANPPIDVTMNPTQEGEFKDVDISGNLVPFIEILGGVKKFKYGGDAVISGAQGSSVTESSHIDLTANVEMPLSMKINEMRFMDTMNFSVKDIGVSNFLDEIEFKFRVNNGMPLKLAMQLYICDSTYIDDPDSFIVDSLFKPDAQGVMHNVIESSFGGEPVKSTIYVTATGETMQNLLRSNKLVVKLAVSTDGREVVLKSTDLIGLGIGLKTKTTNVNIN